MRVRLAAAAAVLSVMPVALPLIAPMRAAASGCLSSLPQVQQVTTAGARSLAGSTPVLFVHGIHSDPEIWGPTSPSSIAGQAAAIPGVTAWTYSYAHQSLDWVSTQQIGPDLASAITCLAAASGHKVIVVGHSMGGLATQYALGQDHGQVAAGTAEVITIGTPYQGSVLLYYLQRLITGSGIGLVLSGQAPEAALAEALLSACAGIATSDLNRNPCGLVSVPRSPVGTALEEHSAQIAALPPWPASVPVLDTAGDIEIRVSAGLFSFSKDFGDIPVSLASATAHDTAGSPVITYCAADRAVLETAFLLNPGPCYHMALPQNPAIVGPVLSAIRAASVTRLTLQLVPDPPLGPDFTTSGDYLQVSGVPVLTAVNAALRQLITRSQAVFGTAWQQRYGGHAVPGVGPGLYSSEPYQGHISASSDVVSALIPVVDVFPGGNDGEVWVAGTYLVPSAAPVTLQSLYASPPQGMAAMEAIAKRDFIARYGGGCPIDTSGDPIGVLTNRYFASSSSYEYWAMTPAGLSIGFPNGAITDEACGRLDITIPWAQLETYLSAQGRQLISELR